MIMTDEQRRWWFATHPEYSRRPKGGPQNDEANRIRAQAEGIDAYVKDRLRYETDQTAIELLKIMKQIFGTGEEWEQEQLGNQSYLVSDTPKLHELQSPPNKEEEEDVSFWDAVARGIENTLEDWDRWLGFGGALISHRRRLARNLEKAGQPRPPGHAAHHIVSTDDGRFPEAIEARKIIGKFNIDIDDAVNGVWLPYKRGIDGGVYHPGLHSREYYQAVVDSLRRAKNRKDAVQQLQRIGGLLSQGKFPW